MTDSEKRLAEKIKRWRKDKTAFDKEVLGLTDLEPWWIDANEDLVDPEKTRIALKAASGVGKTYWEASAIWWFMLCWGDVKQHPRGNATAIDYANLTQNLWTYLSEFHGQSLLLKYLFEWQNEKIFARSHPSTWYFLKRAWQKNGQNQQQALGLAGLHGKYTLAVVDESAGVPKAVIQAFERTLSNPIPGGFNKIIQGGNTTHPNGPLYDAFNTEAKLWAGHTITGDPKNPKRSKRINLEWAKEQIRIHGEDDPFVSVYILCQFPQAAMNALLGPDDVETAFNRKPPKDQWSWAQKKLGVDVAFEGDDRTVLFPRQGLRGLDPIILRLNKSSRTMSADIAAQILAYRNQFRQEATLVDATGGYGEGVISALTVHRHAGEIIPVNFASKPMNPKYLNKRAEMWWEMAEWVKNGGALERTPDLVAELTTPTYTLKNGKLMIEPKDLVKKRLKRSPDIADALALTFGIPDAAGDELANVLPEDPNDDVNFTKHEWDPWARSQSSKPVDRRRSR